MCTSIYLYTNNPAGADKSEGASRGAGGFGKLAGFGAWVGDHAVERRRSDALVARLGGCQGAGVHRRWVIGWEKSGSPAEIGIKPQHKAKTLVAPHTPNTYV